MIESNIFPTISHLNNQTEVAEDDSGIHFMIKNLVLQLWEARNNINLDNWLLVWYTIENSDH
jgi:hypothetical protein